MNITKSEPNSLSFLLFKLRQLLEYTIAINNVQLYKQIVIKNMQ